MAFRVKAAKQLRKENVEARFEETGASWRAPSKVNWGEYTQQIKPKCKVCDRYLECRRCKPAQCAHPACEIPVVCPVHSGLEATQKKLEESNQELRFQLVELARGRFKDADPSSDNP